MTNKKDEKMKKKSTESEDDIFSSLQKETVQGIMAVLFLVLAVFFTLSGFDKAGRAGVIVYPFFKNLFGLGYWLMPILLFILCLSFFNSIKKKLALTHSIGGLLFFLASLSLLHIFTREGGFVGNIISSPLVNFFDVYASVIILLAFIVISFLIMFDIPLKFNLASLFKKPFKKGMKDDDNDLIFSPASVEAMKNISSDDNKYGPLEELENQISQNNIEKKEFGFDFGKTTLSGKEFTPPPLDLLERDHGKPGVGDIKANSNIIKRTLANFGINVEMDEISIGPSITRYALKPAEGVKLSRIVALQNDLALALAAHPIRIEAPIPGKSLVGIEIPNSIKTTVGLGSLLATAEFQESKKALLISLGKGISGMSYFTDLARSPHMLIAGATGSGKSVTIHAIITSLLYRNSPDNLKFIMVDPKRVELTLYNKIPHLLTPVITDAKKTILALKWAAKEMDRRYDILQAESLQNVESYHRNVVEPAIKKSREKNRSRKTASEEPAVETMPYIIIVIDELADIMQAYPRELESAIVRLAQMSRAVGIHLVLSTQRPSVNIITGLIKANIPSRIALQVASQIDSRTILDMAGAEKLLGAGDMLYLSGEMSQPQRIQSAYISEGEVKSVVKYLYENYEPDLPDEINLASTNQSSTFGGKSGGPIFDGNINDGKEDVDDDLYEEARETVIQAGKASTSYLQRKLGIGYARAARLIDILEERGVIGAGSGAKAREILIQKDEDTSVSN